MAKRVRLAAYGGRGNGSHMGAEELVPRNPRKWGRMAISRKLLEGMGLEEKQIESIIDAHSETVDGLKAERDKERERADALKEQAEKVPDLQKRLEEAKAAADGMADWERKYNDEHKALEDFKSRIEAEKATATKAKAYREQVLAKAGIGAEYIDDVMRVTQLDTVKVGEDGAIEGAEELASKAKEKWASFVVKQKTKGSDPATPPKGANLPEGADPDVERRMAERHARMFGTTETKE